MLVSKVEKIEAKLSQSHFPDEHKVNSVQEEACAKCFGVHVLKFEILQITQKKNNQRTSDS